VATTTRSPAPDRATGAPEGCLDIDREHTPPGREDHVDPVPRHPERNRLEVFYITQLPDFTRIQFRSIQLKHAAPIRGEHDIPFIVGKRFDFLIAAYTLRLAVRHLPHRATGPVIDCNGFL
jgi:hypothetical protein